MQSERIVKLTASLGVVVSAGPLLREDPCPALGTNEGSVTGNSVTDLWRPD